MSLTVICGATDKPVSSTCLIDALSEQDSLTGKLFVSFPLIKKREGPHTVDAMLVTPDRGIVVFDLIEGSSPAGFAQRQDDAANQIEARLRLHPELLHHRSLRIEISTFSFAPALDSDITDGNGYVVKTRSSLAHALLSIECSKYSSTTYRFALSVLENTSMLKTRRSTRRVDVFNSRGHTLKALEESIAVLDSNQSAVIIETVDGIQRIRGLSGSGKTTVLALKAAYLHTLNPNWMIAVIPYSHVLERKFRDLIRRFMWEQTGSEPDWGKLRVLSAWGQQAPFNSDESGIYAQYCDATNLPYLGYSEAKLRYEYDDLFEGIFRDAFLDTKSDTIDPLYDAMIVDDAQDLSPYFLRLCYQLLDSHKRLTYAYDQLQSLASEFLPAPECIFREAQSNPDTIALPSESHNMLKSDIVLPSCYHSSRPILVTAYAIGLGVYRDGCNKLSTNFVQTFDRPKLWEEFGYEAKAGGINEGQAVNLRRAKRTSPRLLEDHSSIDDIIQFLDFKDSKEQTEWLIKSIAKNLNEDELRPSDILVINPNRFTTRRQVGLIRSRLWKLEINSSLIGVDTHHGTSGWLEERSVRFASIHRARGNEAGMVYIINAHDGISNRRAALTARTRLLVAITRGKAWVRVLGVGRDMRLLMDEYNQLQEANFELAFRYPSLEEINQIQIVHNDTLGVEVERMQHQRANVDEIINDYTAGTLDDELKARLESVVCGIR